MQLIKNPAVICRFFEDSFTFWAKFVDDVLGSGALVTTGAHWLTKGISLEPSKISFMFFSILLLKV